MELGPKLLALIIAIIIIIAVAAFILTGQPQEESKRNQTTETFGVVEPETQPEENITPPAQPKNNGTATTCSENWSCGEWLSWSTCSNGQQIRRRGCVDQNNCGTTANKPNESEARSCHGDPLNFADGLSADGEGYTGTLCQTNSQCLPPNVCQKFSDGSGECHKGLAFNIQDNALEAGIPETTLSVNPSFSYPHDATSAYTVYNKNFPNGKPSINYLLLDCDKAPSPFVFSFQKFAVTKPEADNLESASVLEDVYNWIAAHNGKCYDGGHAVEAYKVFNQACVFISNNGNQIAC